MNDFSKYIDPAGHRQRLRERFLKSGRQAMADYELLELLLTYAIPRKNTKPIAKALLDQFGNMFNVLHQPQDRLMTIHGVGPNTATLLQLIQACLTRCMETTIEEEAFIKGPEDILGFIRLHLGGKTKECIYALYLDDANRIIHHTEVAAGTVDRVPFYAREILKPAMLYNATGVVLVHNHPEGKPVPSDKDMEATRNLEDSATSLGIRLIDHMIVNRKHAYSIKTAKLL